MILPSMLSRVFLGWDQPFLMRVADDLLALRDELTRTLVIVPTSQAGRRLREALADRSGALLSPTFTTPGNLLKTPSEKVAPEWVERIAWLETLESVSDWSEFDELFPQPPGDVADWAPGLATDLVRLRHALQENGLTLSSAAKRMGGSVESDRWAALARLESQMEDRLGTWNYQSRSRVLAAGISFPEKIATIVLAGVTELPPLIERAIIAWDGSVRVLISAPQDEEAGFSPIGLPLACWAERIMPWPDGRHGSVSVVADHRQEAAEALRIVAEMKTPSDQLAIGSPDAETGDELAAGFTRAGWTAFHPASVLPPAGLLRWFRVWSKWLSDPKLATLADLLAMPATDSVIGGYRAVTAERLSKLRDDWMLIRPDDLRRRMANADFRSDHHRTNAEMTLHSVETLEQWRHGFLRGDWVETMQDLLVKLDPQGEESADMTEWLEQARPMIHRTSRDAGFWIELMLSSLPRPAPQPPPGRVIDILGWLELLFEPGRHLVLCGMNEGKVPARNASDPWLGEAAAKHLGLITQADRAARDAFLYQALVTARLNDGRIDLLCSKSGPGGESMLPSRLLLAAERDQLPERVRFLFREIEPPEAGLRWHAEWKWQPRAVDVSKRIAVTALATYLACPFRFYLKHAVRMQKPEPGRIEWNARDFGNITHEVLEIWGRDAEARALPDVETLNTWLCGQLDRIVDERFGKSPPLAVRVQSEALRQRLSWFSRNQANLHAEGWDVIDVEHAFTIPVADFEISAKIDRIDRHRENGMWRVIDYKTGKVKSVDAQHRKKITTATRLPTHIPADSPVIHPGLDRGKPADFRWTNLQLPLYAAAILSNNPNQGLPTPCYFSLGATEADVGLNEWTDFGATDVDAAMACAEWIVAQISNQVFWPPAEKVEYDDYKILNAGRPMAEMFEKVNL